MGDQSSREEKASRSAASPPLENFNAKRRATFPDRELFPQERVLANEPLPSAPGCAVETREFRTDPMQTQRGTKPERTGFGFKKSQTTETTTTFVRTYGSLLCETPNGPEVRHRWLESEGADREVVVKQKGHHEEKRAREIVDRAGDIGTTVITTAGGVVAGAAGRSAAYAEEEKVGIGENTAKGGTTGGIWVYRKIKPPKEREVSRERKDGRNIEGWTEEVHSTVRFENRREKKNP